MAFIFDGQMCDAAEMDPVLGTGVGMTYGPHEELARPTRPVVMASRVPDALRDGTAYTLGTRCLTRLKPRCDELR